MPYVVDFQVKGLLMATAQMRQFAAATQHAQQALKMAGGGGSGRSGGSGSASNPANAYVQAVRLQTQLNNAQAANIRSQLSLNNAMKRAAAANRNPLQKQVMSLIYSTRIGMGGGSGGGPSVMPLIGRIAPLLESIGIEAGPAAIGLAAVLAAMKAMAEGVEMTKAYFAGGGSMQETRNLAGIGAALGMSPTSIAQSARSYNDYLINNPYAGGRAAYGGYSPNYMGPYGDQDDSKRFIKGLKDMLAAPSDQEALRMTRGSSLEQFNYLRHASKGVQEEVLNRMSQAPTQAEIDAQVKMAMAMDDVMKSAIQLGEMVLPFVKAGLDDMNEHLKFFRYLIDDTQIELYEMAKWFAKVFHFAAPDKPQNAYDDLERLKGKKEASHADAMERHTDALNQNTKALNNQRQVYGGGANASNALPGSYFNPVNYTRQAVNLGQIPI